ncbi:porin family protein [Leeuwenhoekiella sp. NPDC079379]|uniref:porin family protein n=1 Tax=Leeuwenhoekiella sp. NPDC079379 TaxID=3364122 RepID=UPI0037C5743E
MKKLLLILLITASATTFGQNVRYGAKLGLNVSELSGDYDDALSRYGFVAGVFADIPLSGSLDFQPELLYSAQGNKPNSVAGSANAERAELDYLQLPLLLRYNKQRFNVHVGPQVGLAIWNSFNRFEYKNYDVAAVGGIGYQIIDGLSLEARYNFGFVDVVNSAREGKNRYFTLSAAYRL